MGENRDSAAQVPPRSHSLEAELYLSDDFKAQEALVLGKLFAGVLFDVISFVFRKGKYAEEVFDKSKSTFPSDNPFKEENANKTPAPIEDDFEAPPLPPLPFER